MLLKTGIHIRNLELNDIESVFRLGQKIFDWPTEYALWNEQIVLGYYEHSHAVCFVAEKENQIIGFILCFVVDKVGRVEWIAIDEKLRQQGVARELLRRALLVFKLNRVNQITTLSREDGCANRFFNKNGFRDSGLRKTELILAQLDSKAEKSKPFFGKILTDKDNILNNNPEYDALAEVYDLWASADPAFESTHDFYVNVGCKAEGIVVELGVGTGRIAIDVAKMNKGIIGVDISLSMLNQCQQRAIKADVQENVNLIHSDIRFLKLPQKANLIIFPFRSIGHFLTLESKKQALQKIFDQLVPGGLFVFDHYIIDEQWARNHDGVPRLMYTHQLPNEEGIFIWDTYQYDFLDQMMNCTITIEKTNNSGVVFNRIHSPLTFSWIHPDQVRQLAISVGFEVEALYGEFSYAEFNENSSNQVWFLRRPK